MVTGSENLLGEFLGTMVLVVFGCGVCANLTLTYVYSMGFLPVFLCSFYRVHTFCRVSSIWKACTLLHCPFNRISPFEVGVHCLGIRLVGF